MSESPKPGPEENHDPKAAELEERLNRALDWSTEVTADAILTRAAARAGNVLAIFDWPPAKNKVGIAEQGVQEAKERLEEYRRSLGEVAIHESEK